MTRVLLLCSVFVMPATPTVAQSSVSNLPEFEVASVRPNTSGESLPGVSVPLVRLQLGLKLESRRMPLEVVAIDRVERPTQN